MGVIEKVNEPTDWVNAIACSRKKCRELRICLDPKPLNMYIKRTYYKTLTLEEISHKLTSAKHFTKLDAKNGYWVIHLDEESSQLMCFKGTNTQDVHLVSKYHGTYFNKKWTKFWKTAKEVLVYQISAYMAKQLQSMTGIWGRQWIRCKGMV